MTSHEHSPIRRDDMTTHHMPNSKHTSCSAMLFWLRQAWMTPPPPSWRGWTWIICKPIYDPDIKTTGIPSTTSQRQQRQHINIGNTITSTSTASHQCQQRHINHVSSFTSTTSTCYPLLQPATTTCNYNQQLKSATRDREMLMELLLPRQPELPALNQVLRETVCVCVIHTNGDRDSEHERTV